MLLSILVPVYNTEKYLRRCLDSIMNQTCKEYEVILVNDGSGDTSGSICDEYVQKYGNVKVIHKEHGGLASARCAGITSSIGQYIGFVDSDDYIEPYMYEKLLQPIMLDNKIDISVGGHVVDELNGEIKNKLCSSGSVIYEDVHEALKDMFEGKRFIWTLCDKIYSRRLLYDDSVLEKWPYGHGEDTYINEKVFNRARKISFAPIYGYHYCMHTSSMMHVDFDVDRLNLLDFYVEYMKKYERINFAIFNAVWNLFFAFAIRHIRDMTAINSGYQKEIFKYKTILKYWGGRVSIDTYKKMVIDFLCMSLDEQRAWHDDWLKKIQLFCQGVSFDKIYIYGTGKFAEKTYYIFRNLNIEFKGFIETQPQRHTFMNYPVFAVEKIDENANIVLGLNYKNSLDVETNIIANFRNKLSMWQFLSFKYL